MNGDSQWPPKVKLLEVGRQLKRVETDCEFNGWLKNKHDEEKVVVYFDGPAFALSEFMQKAAYRIRQLELQVDHANPSKAMGSINYQLNETRQTLDLVRAVRNAAASKKVHLTQRRNHGGIYSYLATRALKQED